MDSIDPVGSFIPNSSNLMTSEIQRRELEKRNTLSYKQMQAQLQKYKRFNFKLLSTFKENDENESIGKIYESPDVILTVFMTRPYNKPLEKHEIRLGRLLSMDCVFHVLGSQKLTALRDKINCLSDWSVLEDYSENPDKPQNYLTM
uniref:snRNA-activating protein complex subunit 3 n=1 Tax=Romanomermis culicivorax TaxID=13658 RepID=A0A915IHN8_ROMCU